MTKSQNVKNDSVDVCPPIGNSDSSLSSSHIEVRKKINIKLFLIIYLNKRVNLIGHLKSKVLY
jgi:hypothetical protein